MKKILKFIIMLVGVGFLFEIVCSGTQYFIVKSFRVEINFYRTFVDNFVNNIIIYSIICCCLFVFNCIYNYFIVKKLNNKLKILKEKGGELINEK